MFIYKTVLFFFCFDYLRIYYIYIFRDSFKGLTPVIIFEFEMHYFLLCCPKSSCVGRSIQFIKNIYVMI